MELFGGQVLNYLKMLAMLNLSETCGTMFKWCTLHINNNVWFCHGENYKYYQPRKLYTIHSYLRVGHLHAVKIAIFDNHFELHVKSLQHLKIIDNYSTDSELCSQLLNMLKSLTVNIMNKEIYNNKMLIGLPNITCLNIYFMHDIHSKILEGPVTLNCLTLKYYIHLLDNLLVGLQELILYGFRDQLLNVLPENLQKLKMCGKLRQALNHLPKKLINLKMSAFKNNQELNALPVMLQKLKIDGNWTQPIAKLPDLVKLNIMAYARLEYILPTLKILKYDVEKIKNIITLPRANICVYKYNLNKIINWPNALYTCYLPINNLATTITILHFAYNFNQPLIGLVLQIVKITIVGQFDQVLDGLPENLENLKIIDCNFNQLFLYLPQNLKKIYIRVPKFKQIYDNFRQTINNLPNHLIKITFYFFEYMCLFILNNLPKSLKYLNTNMPIGIFLPNLIAFNKKQHGLLNYLDF